MLTLVCAAAGVADPAMASVEETPMAMMPAAIRLRSQLHFVVAR
jgi:hypothetical protein